MNETKTILVVDDEERIRRLIRMYLERDEFIVEEAENGEIALEMALKKDYDVILLDVMMPVMDGLEMCEHLREEKNTPVIMLTAKGEESNRVQGFEVGAVEAIDRTISASVEPPDMKGTYTIAYRVVSADGHPVEGTSKFSVTTGRTVDQSTPAAQQSFVHRHGTHLIWAGVIVVVAVALLLWPLRRKREDS